MKQQQTNSDEEEVQTFTMPTFRPARPTKEIDISGLTEEQFQALRKSDPFMYYSIQPVMEARRSGKTITHAEVMSALQGGVDAAAGGSVSSGRTRVSRKTRISDGCDDITALSSYFDQLQGPNDVRKTE